MTKPKRRGAPCISLVPTGVAEPKRDAWVTRKVDEALAGMDQQELEIVKHLRRARRDAGTEW